MMKSAMTAAILFFAARTGAQAALMAYPEITSLAIDPENPDHIFLAIRGLGFPAAVSTDGGASFADDDEEDAPPGWSTNLAVGTRRYVVVDALWLLRSDDSGATWTNTEAASFVRDQCELAIQKDELQYREEYGSRLPPRSALWHPLFGLYACAYVLLTFLALRQNGSLVAMLTVLRGLTILLLVWSLLSGLHNVVTLATSSQYPLAYWNTSTRMNPRPKLGVAMAIAGLPLPLLTYLAVLWPILPGSKEVLARVFPIPRRQAALAVCAVAGTAFVAFHLVMMFYGCFWE